MNKNFSQSNGALQSIQNSSQNEIILYRPDDTISLNVRLENETVWLTQIQIAELFGVKQPAISKHISNIYSSGELSGNGTYSILEYMGNDGQLFDALCAVSLLSCIDADEMIHNL